MSIAVVTDSTSDLPEAVAKEKSITVVPLNLHFGSEAFKDGVTMSKDDFFSRLSLQNDLPKTSQPSIGDFLAVYEQLGKNHSHIVSIHISTKISGTHASALAASAAMPNNKVKIEVIDSLQASMGLGLAAIAASDAVQTGASFEETIQTARRVSRRSRFMGLLETLEYLHKGGRIGRARLFMGSLLRIKPILELVDGVATPVARPRTVEKGFQMLVEEASKSAPLAAAYALYAVKREPAERLAQELSPFVKNGEAGIARIGSVVGTYLGKGVVGMAFTPCE